MEEFLQLPSRTIRVAVGDATRMNSQLIVGALKRSNNNFDVHAITSNSSSALRELQDLQPDVALISEHLEDGLLSGFKVLEHLRAAGSKFPVVMLLNRIERDVVVDAFRSGARGVFGRGENFKALPKCIRRVYEGQLWASNVELEFLLDLIVNLKPFTIRQSAGMSLLTPREKEVVRLVARGLRNQEISTELNLREHTVRNYLFRIFDKLGMSSRVELVLYACSGLDEPVTSRADANFATGASLNRPRAQSKHPKVVNSLSSVP
jgi:DNA-binding NarL/FixJ family response regulator